MPSLNKFFFFFFLRLLDWLVPGLAFGGEVDKEASFRLVKAPFLRDFVCGMSKR